MIADVEKGNTSQVRLFNLSPDTRIAGMNSSAPGSDSISGVKFSLGSSWMSFPTTAQTFTFYDDDVTSPVEILSKPGSPMGPPVGSTQFLVGLANRLAAAPVKLTALLLQDAPEG